MKLGNLWSYSFRLGLYDNCMPVNYDRSLGRCFELLAPAPRARLLDVGCGGGRLMKHAASWLQSGGYLVGVDIDPDGIIYAMHRAKALEVSHRVALIACDMRDLDRPGFQPFDAAIAHFSIYTLSEEADRHSVVRKIGALLAPGGKFVVTVPSESYRADALMADIARIEAERTDVGPAGRVLRRHVVNRSQRAFIRKAEEAMDQNIFHRYTADELRRHLDASGFADIHIEEIYGGCGYRAVAARAR